MKDKQKNFKVLQRVFDNHTFRIPSIYWLATAIDGDSIPSELMGHAEDWLEAVGGGDAMTGIPYMGSKRKLAPDLIRYMANANPDARHFHDLFGGAGQ